LTIKKKLNEEDYKQIQILLQELLPHSAYEQENINVLRSQWYNLLEMIESFIQDLIILCNNKKISQKSNTWKIISCLVPMCAIVILTIILFNCVPFIIVPVPIIFKHSALHIFTVPTAMYGGNSAYNARKVVKQIEQIQLLQNELSQVSNECNQILKCVDELLRKYTTIDEVKQKLSREDKKYHIYSLRTLGNSFQKYYEQVKKVKNEVKQARESFFNKSTIVLQEIPYNNV